MRVIRSGLHFSLASVKPIEELRGYREACLEATRAAVAQSGRVRERSPADGGPLERTGEVGGLTYVRCIGTGSLFLEQVAEPAAWKRLLTQASEQRYAPEGIHRKIERSRYETVYGPKLEWIEDVLRFERLRWPAIMEVVTPPSVFTPLLHASEHLGNVTTVAEMDLLDTVRSGTQPGGNASQYSEVQAAVLLESLDRVDDPQALLRAVHRLLRPEALLFVTAVVCSGFDVSVLGAQHLYIFPPDRTNCFTMSALKDLLERTGFDLLEASTPGILDVEILRAHLGLEPPPQVPPFERALAEADEETRADFQAFLQQHQLSSFARLVGRKRP